MNFVETVNLIIAQSVILLGLFTWLGKVWANRIIVKEKARTQAEIEKLKALLNRELSELNACNESKVHVGKIQYEREFINYEKIWAFIPTLYDALQAIGVNKHSYEYYKTNLLKFRSLKSELSDMVANLYPFIDVNVYISALACSNVLGEQRNSLNEHLDYLESKANQKISPSKEKEDVFGELITDIEKRLHILGVELGKTIKLRNENMIVLSNAI